MPLSKYIECLVNKNLNALTISGFPTREELQDAWFEIQQQYADAMGDNEQRAYFELMREAGLLKGAYEQVGLCAKRLYFIEEYFFSGPEHPLYEDAKTFIERFGREINRLTNSKFDFKDHSNFHKNIQRCINRSVSLKISYELKYSQLKAIEDKFEKGEEPTKSYFYSILITLSDHAKYQLNDSITVFEFCERIKRLNDGRIKGTDTGVYRS